MQKHTENGDGSNSNEDVPLPRRDFLRMSVAAAAASLIPADLSFSDRPGVLRGVPQWNVANGLIQKNGEAVFPLGIYYVSHWPHQKDTRLEHLKIIDEIGFNTVHTPIDLEDEAVLNFCRDHDIAVAVEFNDVKERVLEQFSGHPAIAFLQTFDDVDARDRSSKVLIQNPDLVREESERINALASNTLTYASGGHPADIGRYINSTDLLGMQAYPIPAEPLSAVGNQYLPALAGVANRQKRPFIANLQCFNWRGENRYPTPAELRNMTYQALAMGAKGISYYTFFDYNRDDKSPQNDLSTRLELTDQLTLLLGEIKARQDRYLHGVFSPIRPIDTQSKELFVASWLYQDRLTYLFVNAGQTVLPIGLKVPVLNDNYQVAVPPADPRPIYLTSGELFTELPAENVLMLEFESLSIKE